MAQYAPSPNALSAGGLGVAMRLPPVADALVFSPEVENAISVLRSIFPDATPLRNAFTKYLLRHGDDDAGSEEKIFPLTGFLPEVSDEQMSLLRQALTALRLSLASSENVLLSGQSASEHEPSPDGGEEATFSASSSHSDARALELALHPTGSIARAVATGFALRLLHCLQQRVEDIPSSVAAALDPRSTLECAFYVHETAYKSVEDAVRSASKRLHKSVLHLPDDVFFDIAEGVCLYNKAQYWSLLATGDVPVESIMNFNQQPTTLQLQTPAESKTSASTNEAEAAELAEPVEPLQNDDASSPSSAVASSQQNKVRISELWRPKWIAQLDRVRKLLVLRDYASFLADCPYLTLAGRFPMGVPTYTVQHTKGTNKADDSMKQSDIFDDVLRRVDRHSVTRLLAHFQRAQDQGRSESTIRQSKHAGVIRALGEAIGSIRTPIKTVDLCLQAFTLIAQNIACNRPQLPVYADLYPPRGFAGDLLEHGFVVSQGREQRDGGHSGGMTIATLIAKNFLHRRDAWAVLSQLHPTCTYVNERLVQEASRRAFPKVFAAEPLEKATTSSGSSPTHYRAADDLFLTVCSSVVLSTAVTNANAKRTQIASLRPCLGQLVQNIADSLRYGHCKIPGWDAQQVRLGVASARILHAVLRDWIENEGTATSPLPGQNAAAPDEASGDASADIPEAPSGSEPQTLLPPLVVPSDFATKFAHIVELAPLPSYLLAGVVDVLALICGSNETVVNTILGSEGLHTIVSGVSRRFAGDDKVPACLHVNEAIVTGVVSLLTTLYAQHEIGSAANLLIDLAKRRCDLFGLAAVKSLTKLLTLTTRSDDHRAFVTSIAEHIPSLFTRLMQGADVTAIHQIAVALTEFAHVSTSPEAHRRLEGLLVECWGWLQKNIESLILEEHALNGLDVADEEGSPVDSSSDEVARRAVRSARNGIICAVLEAARVITQNITLRNLSACVRSLAELIGSYMDEVPYLNILLQCLENVTTKAPKPIHVSKELRSLLRGASDVSKASARTVSKILAAISANTAKGSKRGGQDDDEAEVAEVSVEPEADQAVPVRSLEGKLRVIIKRVHDVLPPPPPISTSTKAAKGSGKKIPAQEEGAAPSTVAKQSAESSAKGPSAPNAARPKLVSLKGDESGINLDFLSAKIASTITRKQREQEHGKTTTPKNDASWATVAKGAKAPHERMAERAAAELEEDNRLLQIAAEAEAERRRQKQATDDRRLKEIKELTQLKEDIRRNRGAIDPVDESPAPPTGAEGAGAMVDVRDLLSMILPQSVSVRRVGGREGSVRQLPTIDDDQSTNTTQSATLTSLSQLRLGEATTVRAAPRPGPPTPPAVGDYAAPQQPFGHWVPPTADGSGNMVVCGYTAPPSAAVEPRSRFTPPSTTEDVARPFGTTPSFPTASMLPFGQQLPSTPPFISASSHADPSPSHSNWGQNHNYMQAPGQARPAQSAVQPPFQPFPMPGAELWQQGGPTKAQNPPTTTPIAPSVVPPQWAPLPMPTNTNGLMQFTGDLGSPWGGMSATHNRSPQPQPHQHSMQPPQQHQHHHQQPTQTPQQQSHSYTMQVPSNNGNNAAGMPLQVQVGSNPFQLQQAHAQSTVPSSSMWQQQMTSAPVSSSYPRGVQGNNATPNTSAFSVTGSHSSPQPTGPIISNNGLPLNQLAGLPPTDGRYGASSHHATFMNGFGGAPPTSGGAASSLGGSLPMQRPGPALNGIGRAPPVASPHFQQQSALSPPFGGAPWNPPQSQQQAASAPPAGSSRPPSNMGNMFQAPHQNAMHTPSHPGLNPGYPSQSLEHSTFSQHIQQGQPPLFHPSGSLSSSSSQSQLPHVLGQSGSGSANGQPRRSGGDRNASNTSSGNPYAAAMTSSYSPGGF